MRMRLRIGTALACAAVGCFALSGSCERVPTPPAGGNSDSSDAALYRAFDTCRRGPQGRSDDEAPLSDALECLSKHTGDEQLRIARYAAGRNDLADRQLGIVLLVAQHREREAAPFVAALVQRGERFEAVGFVLIHSGMEHGALRLYAETGDYLLDPARNLPPSEYVKARQFVCDNATKPIDRCTDESARAALRDARAAAQP
jgi:hypothetical protein